MGTNAFDESRRITKIIFDKIYGEDFENRDEFEKVVIDVVKLNKIDKVKYDFSSLYLHRNYTFHIFVSYDGCGSPTTFTFNMIWKDEMFKNGCYTDNVSVFIGAPCYWYFPKEGRVPPDYVDIREIETI